MVGLEPGDEAHLSRAIWAVGIVRFAEAQEGVHLVDVAPHRFGHKLEAMHQRVTLHFEQVALAVQDAPDELVEQRETLGIAMTDRQSNQVRHLAGQGDRRRLARLRHRRAEQIIIVSRAPQNGIGRCVARDKGADGTAKAVEIGAVLHGHADHAHQKRLACSGAEARCGRRSSAPSSRAGGR